MWRECNYILVNIKIKMNVFLSKPHCCVLLNYASTCAMRRPQIFLAKLRICHLNTMYYKALFESMWALWFGAAGAQGREGTKAKWTLPIFWSVLASPLVFIKKVKMNSVQASLLALGLVLIFGAYSGNSLFIKINFDYFSCVLHLAFARTRRLFVHILHWAVFIDWQWLPMNNAQQKTSLFSRC